MTVNLSETKMGNFKDYYLWFQGLFYFLQGFSLTGIMVFLTFQLAVTWGLNYAEIATITVLVTIPIFLKMIPGLLSDRVPIGKFGRRKPYIILGTFLTIPGYILISIIKEFSWMFIASYLLVMIAWVFIDGTLDALTVDITPPEKIDKMQGFAVTGRMLGYAAGGISGVLLANKIGWSYMLLIMGAFSVGQGLIGLVYPEPKNIGALLTEIPLKKVFKETFGSSRSWMNFAFAILILVSGGIAGLTNAFVLSEKGWGSTEELILLYGFLVMVQNIAAGVGAFVYGYLGPKIKNKRNYFIVSGVVIWALILPMIALIFTSSTAVIFLVNVGLGAAMGITIVVAQSLAQKECPRSIEGFYFATLTSFMNIGQVMAGPMIIGAFSVSLGLIPAIYTLIPVTVVAVVLGILISKKAEESCDDLVDPTSKPDSTASDL
ncbi:MAG: MFS transporter [Candidatus Heimdallarchaeaceae archaeon]